MKNDEFTGCGISDVWATDESDPFYKPCIDHDSIYSLKNPFVTRHEADKVFLAKMLEIAGNSWGLKAKAYLYYFIVRCFGAPYWG